MTEPEDRYLLADLHLSWLEADERGAIDSAHRRGQFLRAWDAATGDPRRAMSYALEARRYCRSRGLSAEYAARVQPLIERCQVCDPVAQATLRVAVCQALLNSHEPEAASTLFTAALEDPDTPPFLLAAANSDLGHEARRADRLEEAEDRYAASLAVAAGADNAEILAVALLGLASIRHRQERQWEGLALVEQAGQAVPDDDEPHVRAQVSSQRSELLLDLGRPDEAATAAEDSLYWCAQAGEPGGRARALSSSPWPAPTSAIYGKRRYSPEAPWTSTATTRNGTRPSTSATSAQSSRGWAVPAQPPACTSVPGQPRRMPSPKQPP